jgi:hypothetical protein
MGETAKVAKKKLKCAIYRRPPYFRKAGHQQVCDRTLNEPSQG